MQDENSKQTKTVTYEIVRDMIHIIRDKFGIHRTGLVLLDENCSQVMKETDEVQNGRTYIVKRIPSY